MQPLTKKQQRTEKKQNNPDDSVQSIQKERYPIRAPLLFSCLIQICQAASAIT